ncbi:hypothetical protein CL653_03160, partial [bacterium]|nr:hypothetical protein [bacterium]
MKLPIWTYSMFGAIILGATLLLPVDGKIFDPSQIYGWEVEALELEHDYEPEPDWYEDFVIPMETSMENIEPIRFTRWERTIASMEGRNEIIAGIDMLAEDTREELLCLAINMYHEARGSTVEDQVATAQVVINRTQHWAWSDTICEVIWEDYQFSWTHDNIPDRPRNTQAWVDAQILVYNIYLG